MKIPMTMSGISRILFWTFNTILIFFQIDIAIAQNNSNRGTEFWVPYMAHIRGATNNPNNSSMMNLYITSDINTVGEVAVADGSFKSSFNVTANQVTVIKVPPSAFIGSEGKFLKGIHITAERPVVVYAHIFAQAVSGATLVLPVNTLSNDYYSINFTQKSNEENVSFSVFTVIATEDETKVEITPTQRLVSGRTAAGETFYVNLRKGEIYQALSRSDLTGSRIRSVSSDGSPCKKIAVFSGSSKITIGCTPDGTSDNLFQQVYPSISWGKSFITVPMKLRPYDIYRVMVRDPSTRVLLNGVLMNPANLINGFYYEFPGTRPNTIEADKPIQVVQYAVSQHASLDCSRNEYDIMGDPEMIFLSPIEQNISEVTLYSPPYYSITQHYINVNIKTESAATFRIDGRVPPEGFNTVPGNPEYVYGQFSIGPGTHYIEAADGFNAIAYGYGEFESYGYSAGTNIRNLSQYIEMINNENQEKSASGCAGQRFLTRLVLPYEPTQITWEFNNGSPAKIINTPQYHSTFEFEGKTLYVYENEDLVQYNSAGAFFIKASSFNPFGSDCGSVDETYFNFEVFETPVAQFNAPAAYCLNDTLAFVDESDGKEKGIKSWLWDFGDGTSSSVQNAKHRYASPGAYIVSLTITSPSGCTSIKSDTVLINPAPIADFTFVPESCEEKTVRFADKSTPDEGETIKQWIWDFGDGQQLISDNGDTFVHQYNESGIYEVTLQVINQNDCASEVKLYQVVVSHFPVVDFSIPEICVTDSFAEFFDQSVLIDVSETEVNYHWDFGDQFATDSNPNFSTMKNANHRYTRPGNYQVTLSVTINESCVAVLTKTLTVNGASPKADFEVLNADMLCSNQEVAFRNTSTVDFGSITRIEFFYDFGNQPQMMEVDEEPAFDKLYTYIYPDFHQPVAKNYQVRMRSYSGKLCVDEVVKVITLKASPDVQLSIPDSVCEEAVPVQLFATHGDFNGRGVFSGSGVGSSGQFNPAQAGVGEHTIRYVFVANNGCSDTVSKIIRVLPSPQVYAGRDTSILEEESIQLAGQSATAGASYKWTPSTGLNRDDILNPVAKIKDDMIYTLTVTSSSGCVNSSQVKIKVLKKPVIPNSFSPNGDGINDFWNITHLESYPNCTVEIYNRYGEKLYSSFGYSIPWDGRFKGAEMPVGTYYYIINPRNGRKVMSGSVTIIK
jgi:gliding motility-associated-like protein